MLGNMILWILGDRALILYMHFGQCTGPMIFDPSLYSPLVCLKCGCTIQFNLYSRMSVILQDLVAEFYTPLKLIRRMDFSRTVFVPEALMLRRTVNVEYQ